MILFKTASLLTEYLKEMHGIGKRIGFVPTMGALHQGHISLIERCKIESDITVCSIFVNPTQFNNADDFKRYPVTIEDDIDLLEKNGCDILFMPSVEEIYPADIKKEQYDLGYIETILEGKFRPGHFQGVCQVVDRLLQIVHSDILFLGQKDYQQCMVINKMITLKKYPVSLSISSTLREPGGLAMSSRNKRLNDRQRKNAVRIFETLTLIKNEIKKGSLDQLKIKAIEFLEAAGFKVDYVEFADAANLELINEWDGNRKIVVLIAASIDDIRLIDNMVLN